MRPQYIMFLGLLFAAGTVISLTFSGAWLGTGDVEVTNALTVFKQANILGIWTVTLPNISFFLVGFKAIMMMDFGFFQGGLALLQWFFFLVIGTGALWGLYTVVILAFQGLFKR